ncbi:MAG TPA: inositol monophosphatase family protein [Rhodanobacteraceae bacterium]|nr:inositol monophosphatase family protein [Rhodanobacteraceae bacterium]
MQASKELVAMIEAAQTAGKALLGWSRRLSELDVRTKNGPADMVSQADVEAEGIVRGVLGRVRPGYAFLGEEGGSHAGDADNQWIVDPLDGTTNFLFGTPLWGINVALARAGRVVAGVILLPALDELYVAEQGQGAWLNGRRIHVSTREHLNESVLGCGIPFAGKPEHPLFAREMALLTSDIAGIRRTGACSVDMAWVAAGRWDAYWERSLCAWDMAPGLILAEEAGGRASDCDGSPYRLEAGNVCISNGRLHAALIERLAQARSSLSGTLGRL